MPGVWRWPGRSVGPAARGSPPPLPHCAIVCPPGPKRRGRRRRLRAAGTKAPVLFLTARGDEFDKVKVNFGLEVHPTEIAFDLHTAKRALEAIGNRPAFGFNFDPSHLVWQGVDPVKFIEEFPDRIYHVHMKDAAVTLDGRSGILSSHLDFGDGRRGWDFRSLGHGDVKFGEIIRALNRINYQGPLSVEWEDCGMEREHGAREAAAFVKEADFTPSSIVFDAAFDDK